MSVDQATVRRIARLARIAVSDADVPLIRRAAKARMRAASSLPVILRPSSRFVGLLVRG